MYVFRTCLALTILAAFGAHDLTAQKKKSTDDQGYIPQVLPDKPKKQKKGDDQTLPPARELPNTVVAETGRRNL